MRAGNDPKDCFFTCGHKRTLFATRASGRPAERVLKIRASTKFRRLDTWHGLLGLSAADPCQHKLRFREVGKLHARTFGQCVRRGCPTNSFKAARLWRDAYARQRPPTDRKQLQLLEVDNKLPKSCTQKKIFSRLPIRAAAKVRSIRVFERARFSGSRALGFCDSFVILTRPKIAIK